MIIKFWVNDTNVPKLLEDFSVHLKLDFMTVSILNFWFVSIESLRLSPAKNINSVHHNQTMQGNFEGEISTTQYMKLVRRLKLLHKTICKGFDDFKFFTLFMYYVLTILPPKFPHVDFFVLAGIYGFGRR